MKKEELLQYDLFQAPTPTSSNRKPCYFARPVGVKNIGTEQLVALIQRSCTLTPSDLKGVLTALSDFIAIELQQGNHVYLEGIGTLGITLSCPTIADEKKIHAADVKFSHITLQIDKLLKSKLQQTKCQRIETENRRTVRLSDIERDQVLTEYFKDADCITRTQFQKISFSTRTTATHQLDTLVEEGRLIRIGTSHMPYYQPTPGNYHK